ncbi:uncharacterized protein [Epargyreus clarus]|uniref:uncharacterized protein n=1 Tax=Epargyreus clarus TaxID=520877 RepID=UPI003C2D9C56
MRFIFKLISLILNLISAECKINYVTNENPRTDHIIECAIEIANVNFNYRKQTVILTRDVDESISNKFLQYYEGTVIVEMKTGGQPPRQLVIILDSYYSFMRILGKLKPDLKGHSLLHSAVKILIVLLSKPHRLERINKVLWEYYATDAVIIIGDKTNKISMYTYFPYKNHRDCQNVEPKFIGYWNETVGLDVEIYPDKMRNMQGCPMYISTNKVFPATEQKIALQVIKKTIVRLLREALNFTSIISSRDYDSVDFDRPKNWSDCLNDVIIGATNISTCSHSFGIDRIGLLDYSMPYFRVSLAWMAPPTSPGPMWWRLLSPLNGYLWLVLLIVIIFVKSLPFIMKLKKVKRFCRQYFKNIDKLHNVAIRSWGVLVGQTIRVAPRRFRDFYIVGMWIWFTFVVRNAYQSVLIGALKYDGIVGNFLDLKETVDEGFTFGGRADMLAHFEHDPFIRDGYIVVPEEKFEQVFHEVLEGKRKFVVATSLEFAWTYCLSRGLVENQCGHVLPDSIMTVPLFVWTRRDSPFTRPLIILLPRLLESGLLERDTMKEIIPKTSKASEPTPLTSNQTLSCMLCLLLGYTISTIVFVLEVFNYRSTTLKELKKIQSIKITVVRRAPN